jgi:hypothetical protein
MMKKLITLSFGLLLAISAVSTASAAYCVTGNTGYMYGYFGNGCVTTQPVQQSYYYTQGCYTYYYDAYTLSSRAVSYNCQTYTNTVNYTYYTQPTMYTTYPTSAYYTYGYDRSSGTWYPRYSDTNIWSTFNNTNYYNNYNNGFVNTPNVNCYYLNGYQICQ